MLVGSLVREAEAAPSCDELREQQVDDDHGQDGDGDHHVHLAHIELQEVCTARSGWAGDFVLLDLFFERLEIRILHIY